MYVGGGRRGYPGEVRLVRVRPCDSRAGRHMKRRRTRRGFKAAALGLAAASLLGACLCGIYLLVDSRPQGEVVELMAEKLPEEVPGSPLDVGSVNIVQALEKPEPEPQPQEQPTQQPTPEPEAAGVPVGVSHSSRVRRGCGGHWQRRCDGEPGGQGDCRPPGSKAPGDGI